jgi:hypothetical protein
MLSGHHAATHLDDRGARRDGGVIQIHIALVVQQNRGASPFTRGWRHTLRHHATTKLPVFTGAGKPVVHLCPTMTIVPVSGDVVITVLVDVLRIIRVAICRQGENDRPAVDRSHVTVHIAQRHGVPDEYLVAQYREIRTDQRLGSGRIIRVNFQRVGAGPQAGLTGKLTKFFSVAFHREYLIHEYI